LKAEEALAELLDVFAPTLPEGKALEVRIQGDGVVFAERNALLQVVSELLVNARDFSGPTGAICLSVHPEECGGAWVVVDDQGPGFSSDLDLDRVVEPFVGTRRGTGRGIGLTAVSGVMAAHGGRVECSNDGGARVACFFPGSPPRPKATEADRSVSVWVLEDEPALLDFIVEALSTQGFVVEPFLAADALMQAYLSGEKPDPDVLLLDVVSPDVSGPDLLQGLQSKGFSSSVLWSSGFTPEATDLKVSGRESFLQKPYTSSELCEAVGRLVQ
jgi:CheY-like chemotaxis protein